MECLEKAPSDIQKIDRLSFQIALYPLVKQMENLTLLHQKSLRALYHAPPEVYMYAHGARLHKN